MGMNKKNARADVAAPTRAVTEEKPLTGDLRPQIKHTTEMKSEQVKSTWSFEDEIRIIDKLIEPYAKLGRKSLRARQLHYNEGVDLICSFPFSPEGNEYGRIRLARLLRY